MRSNPARHRIRISPEGPRRGHHGICRISGSIRAAAQNIHKITFWGSLGSFIFILFLSLPLIPDVFIIFFFLAGGNWTKKEFEARLWRRGVGQPKGMWGAVTAAYCVRTWGMLTHNRCLPEYVKSTPAVAASRWGQSTTVSCVQSPVSERKSWEGVTFSSLLDAEHAWSTGCARLLECIVYWASLSLFCLYHDTGVWFMVTIRDLKRTSNVSLGTVCSQYPSVPCRFLEKAFWKVKSRIHLQGSLYKKVRRLSKPFPLWVY